MYLAKLTGRIYEIFLQFLPLLRMAWAVTVILGMAMLVIAIVLKRNPAKKKSPWIVGGVGLLAVIGSGMQLLTSLLL